MKRVYDNIARFLFRLSIEKKCEATSFYFKGNKVHIILFKKFNHDNFKFDYEGIKEIEEFYSVFDRSEDEMAAVEMEICDKYEIE